jgi:hypothetical protein
MARKGKLSIICDINIAKQGGIYRIVIGSEKPVGQNSPSLRTDGGILQKWRLRSCETIRCSMDEMRRLDDVSIKALESPKY